MSDLTQREVTDQAMIVTREWADCGATQDGGIWVAQPFPSEAATLSGNSDVREGGGFDLDREKVIDGENSRIQSDSSSSELE